MNKEFEEYINALKEVEKENDNFELTLSKSEVLFIVKNFEQLENIIKEALIELSYMSTNMFDEDYDIKEEKYQLFLNILNKGSEDSELQEDS